MVQGVTRPCARCGDAYTAGGGKPLTPDNEYCQSCRYEVVQFWPKPEPNEPEPDRCQFCEAPIEDQNAWGGQKKYCNEDHRRWYHEGRNPDEIKKQLCVVCQTEYEAPVGRATCSRECAEFNRWDMRGRPDAYCKRCGEHKGDDGRRCCDDCWEEFKEENWGSRHAGGIGG